MFIFGFCRTKEKYGEKQIFHLPFFMSQTSPFHHWYNEMTDDDNPVLVLGKVRN